jgi:3-hydroxyisobutyrate dehydrogenase-like beta-hydroxyacid dehydrogenase
MSTNWPGFRLRLGWKDVRLVLQLAQETETPMPIGSLLRDRFLSALAKNRGTWIGLRWLSALRMTPD